MHRPVRSKLFVDYSYLYDRDEKKMGVKFVIPARVTWHHVFGFYSNQKNIQNLCKPTAPFERTFKEEQNWYEIYMLKIHCYRDTAVKIVKKSVFGETTICKINIFRIIFPQIFLQNLLNKKIWFNVASSVWFARTLQTNTPVFYHLILDIVFLH